YGFIAIVKEALNNVMKHSNATWVQVVAREHPGMYQLVIEDNGTSGIGRKHDGYGGGIGIRNMKERVDTFGGNLEIQTQKGWRIHITVPKKADER
ncbi:MAG: sensor histidine kinase, partial [Lachnospiraceae bacterium]|nr:sensor histidine kinase [Lachnospiraceae bacterium]